MGATKDFKAGLKMAKQAPKRATRQPAKKSAAPKISNKTTKKTAPKKAVANSSTKPKASAAPRKAPAKRKAASITTTVKPALQASQEALTAGFEGGIGDWQGAGVQAQAAYAEVGRLAIEAALEMGRRNLEFQRQILVRGVELSREFRT